jgi:hypothetical protein
MLRPRSFAGMNLRDQLRNLLPNILPDDPENAIKGTELIRLVRLRLGDEYSDATLRYHFSILSYDSSSPIAKVDQGQGYYQRLNKSASVDQGNRLLFGDEAGTDRLHARFQRLLAIYTRLCLLRSHYPFAINGHGDTPPDVRGRWDVPDLVTAEWDLETGSDEISRFDTTMLNLRRHLGRPEVSLGGVQLKLSLNLDNYACEFFQALSASRWAMHSELVIAEPLNDEALVEALRTLGHQYGVGISCLGINAASLDDLPSARELLAMNAAEFESVQSRLRQQKITHAPTREGLDWQTLSTLRKKHPAVTDLVRWLGECLERQQPTEPK